MLTLNLPVPFLDDVGAFLSAAEIGMLRDNAILLDQLAYRRMACFDSSAGPDTGAVDLHSSGDIRVWWGSIYYQDGMEDLVIAGEASSYGSAFLRVYINGASNSDITMGATFVHTIDISSGYSAGDVIIVEIRTIGNTTKTSKYLIKDIYATPLTVATDWPASLPTFAGTYDADSLNTIVQAQQHLWERICAIPITPTTAHVWAPATHKVESHTLYTGAVGRYQDEDQLHIYGNVQINNTEEHFTVDVGGVTAYTSPDYILGQSVPIDVFIALAHTMGTRAEVRIKAVVTDDSNQPAAGGGTNSRYNLWLMRSRADTVTPYPVQAPPDELLSNTSYASTAVDNCLNDICDMLAAIKAQIDGAPALWNRARACRARYAQDDRQNTKLMRRHPLAFQRLGDRLIVRGKGASIGWDATTVKSKETGLDYDDYTFAHEESIIDGDKADTVTVYLDTLPGLYPGMLYYVFGTGVAGAWERIDT